MRMQGKAYPRQWWVQGRVRVQLKKPDGSLVNPDVPDRGSPPASAVCTGGTCAHVLICHSQLADMRAAAHAGKTLLLRVAELVPKHPGRSKKAQAAAAAVQARVLQAAGPSGGDAGGKAAAGGGGKKKKGKK